VAGVGKTHEQMYSHGISTLMLSEVSGMVAPQRQEKIDKALPKALKLILVAQRARKRATDQGGWRYRYDSPDSDISCTAWQLMALRSARNNGAPVPKQAVDEAVRYILSLRLADGGFGYTDASEPTAARTGTALLCLELTGRGRDAAATGAGDWILRHMPQQDGEYFYSGLYYCSQGMFQLGGDYWQRWEAWMYEAITKSQRPDGSWPAGQRGETSAGPCFSTAMSVLALSVTYRQLPIYQQQVVESAGTQAPGAPRPR